MTLFTSNSKSAKAWLLAIALVIAVNAWVGWQLPRVTCSFAVDDCRVLQDRIERYPQKQAVKVVILGNSHALAGLRPPDIARALGLPAGAVFSFALPSGTPEEMRVLADHYLGAFPHARLALCGMDEAFLLPPSEYHMRYWTRFDLIGRYRFAMQAPTVDERVARLTSWFFPVADFLTPIRSFLNGDKRGVLHNLFKSPVYSKYYTDLEAMRYPWGLPPPWDCPDLFNLQQSQARDQRPEAIRERAAGFMNGESRAPQAFVALEQLSETLSAHHCRLVLIGTPYPHALMHAVEKNSPSAYTDYTRRLAEFLRHTRTPMVAAPDGWKKRWFYDADHLNPAGANRLANWVATRFAHSDRTRPARTGLDTAL